MILTPEQLENLPEPQRQAYLSSLNFGDLLELALAGTQRLNQIVEQIPLGIMDTWEARLASDGKSAAATQEFMARLQAP